MSHKHKLRPMKKEKKQDNSVRVPQRDKLTGSVSIRQPNWTDKQKELLSIIDNKDSKIVFVSGPAGTAKTLIAVYSCLKLLNEKKISDIMYVRAAVESADSKLGFLPGTVDEKLAYYGLPLQDKLEELIGQEDYKYLVKDNRIEVAPVNYTRGRSWNSRGIIIDEAQNMTTKELITILTRLGRFNKCFVLGDPMQSDINGRSGGFASMMELFKSDGKENGVFTFQFSNSDIMRSELTKYLVGKFQELVSQQQEHPKPKQRNP